MTGTVYPELPAERAQFLEKPFGGLFGKTVLSQVVEEVVADPSALYTPKYLQELTGASAPRLREALATLVSLRLLHRKEIDRQHPVFSVNTGSKVFVALSFLAYAVLDDRDGSGCMDQAVCEYYQTTLREECEPFALASTVDTEYVAEDGTCTGCYGAAV
jgi:hypothetical protein